MTTKTTKDISTPDKFILSKRSEMRSNMMRAEKLQNIAQIFNIYKLLILKEASFGKVSFKNLKQITTCSDGNLANHLKKLVDCDLLIVTKEFENNYPCTSYTLSKKGDVLFTSLKKTLINILEANEKW